MVDKKRDKGRSNLRLPITLPTYRIVNSFRHPPRVACHRHQSRHPARAGRRYLPLRTALQLHVRPQPGAQGSRRSGRPLPLHPQPRIHPTARRHSPDRRLRPDTQHPRSPPMDEAGRRGRHPLPACRLRGTCSTGARLRSSYSMPPRTLSSTSKDCKNPVRASCLP